MTAALEVGEWSPARPGRTLAPGKTRYPFYRRLGGPQGRSGRAENLVPIGIRSRTVQPGSSVAIPTELPGPHIIMQEEQNFKFIRGYSLVAVSSVRRLLFTAMSEVTINGPS